MTRQIRIVADDEDFVRSALRRLLEAAGVDIERFASPDDLRACLHHESCDCLLLSVWVPDPRCKQATDRHTSADDPVVLVRPGGRQTTH